MTNEWEEEIFDKYPHFFQNKDDPQRSLMGFGFGIGPGWHHLIEELLELANSIVERYDDVVRIKRSFIDPDYEGESEYDTFKGITEEGDKTEWWLSGASKEGGYYYPGWIDDYFEKTPERPEMEVVQVKEKFGGLRFYYNSRYMGGFDQAVRLAENLSYRICMFCGAPGELRNDLSWILTLCDGCHEARLEAHRNAVKNRRFGNLLEEEE